MLRKALKLFPPRDVPKLSIYGPKNSQHVSQRDQLKSIYEEYFRYFTLFIPLTHTHVFSSYLLQPFNESKGAENDVQQKALALASPSVNTSSFSVSQTF